MLPWVHLEPQKLNRVVENNRLACRTTGEPPRILRFSHELFQNCGRWATSEWVETTRRRVTCKSRLAECISEHLQAFSGHKGATAGRQGARGLRSVAQPP